MLLARCILAVASCPSGWESYRSLQSIAWIWDGCQHFAWLEPTRLWGHGPARQPKDRDDLIALAREIPDFDIAAVFFGDGPGVDADVVACQRDAPQGAGWPGGSDLLCPQVTAAQAEHGGDTEDHDAEA